MRSMRGVIKEKRKKSFALGEAGIHPKFRIGPRVEKTSIQVKKRQKKARLLSRANRQRMGKPSKREKDKRGRRIKNEGGGRRARGK